MDDELPVLGGRGLRVRGWLVAIGIQKVPISEQGLEGCMGAWQWSKC